ncbi:MAG: tRNA (N6-isopentenyl adenosine(37)-C2)-methylthiotransferase MiaB [Moorellales bacterium]
MQKKTKKYLTFTYGCQMNEHDTEVMAGLLEEAGYRRASDPQEADLILINTCSVREKAENKVYGQLGQLLALKRRRPELIIGLAGCMAQRLGAEVRWRVPQVDFVVGPGDLYRLPEVVRRAEEERQFVLATGSLGVEPVENLPVRRADRLRAYVTISYGCNNFCTYCVVPYLRGPERSRRPENILAEVAGLAREGYKEVMLLGQNVNTYGRDLPEPVDFGDLLKAVEAIKGIERIRYTTSHPRDFSAELVEVVATGRKICEHFHLPAQAGSDRVLERMRRGYTREHYLNLARTIRRRLPEASITTDLIVGFPGETEEDFEATLDLVEQVRFDAAFTFMYSPRPGTAAAEFPDQVAPEVKRQRLLRLNRLQNRLSRESNERLVGRTVEVLVEGPSKTDPQRLAGRTRTNKIVVFSGPQELVGRLVHLRITEAQTFNLFGELV